MSLLLLLGFKKEIYIPLNTPVLDEQWRYENVVFLLSKFYRSVESN